MHLSNSVTDDVASKFFFLFWWCLSGVYKFYIVIDFRLLFPPFCFDNLWFHLTETFVPQFTCYTSIDTCKCKPHYGREKRQKMKRNNDSINIVTTLTLDTPDFFFFFFFDDTKTTLCNRKSSTLTTKIWCFGVICSVTTGKMMKLFGGFINGCACHSFLSSFGFNLPLCLLVFVIGESERGENVV